MTSMDQSIEESINPNQLDSPVSNSRSKAKTVSFQIKELEGNHKIGESADLLETEATELLTKISQASNTAAKTGRLGNK